MGGLSHVTLGTNDPERAGRFYDAILAPLGWLRLPKPPGKPPAYAPAGSDGNPADMPILYLYTPEDGRPATWGNGTHVAFVAPSRDAVARFHALALEHGGLDEGAPGPRDFYGAGDLAAYVRDPDGNKLQAVYYADA